MSMIGSPRVYSPSLRRSSSPHSMSRARTPLSTSYLLTGGNGKAGNKADFAHAKTFYNPARNSLYARFSHEEWTRSNGGNYSMSENEKSSSSKQRANAWQTIKELDLRTRNRQCDNTKKLADRIQDIVMWKNELTNEISAMETESANLREFKRMLEKAYMDTATPLNVSEECLIAREQRQGIDQVHDEVEKSLIREVGSIRKCQEKMKKLLQKAAVQLKMNRAAQDACERDKKDKNQAHYTDDKMHQMRNSTVGTGFYPGIETVDATISIPVSWEKFTQDNIRRSQSERAASERLRSAIEDCLRACTNEMWSNYNNVNNKLKERIQETTDARNKLQAKLQQTTQEIYDMNKQIQHLRRALLDLEPPLKVAMTRLQERTTRPNVEHCHDIPMSSLQREVHEIKESMRVLKDKLKASEATMARLMKTKSILSSDIEVKENSLQIDQKKCVGMRQSVPTDASVGPIFQMTQCC